MHKEMEMTLPKCKVFIFGSEVYSEYELNEEIENVAKEINQCETNIEEYALMRPEDWVFKSKDYKAIMKRGKDIVQLLKDTNAPQEKVDKATEILDTMCDYIVRDTNKQDLFDDIKKAVREEILALEVLSDRMSRLKLLQENLDVSVREYLENKEWENEE